MRELVPDDSIAYAVDRVGPETMANMPYTWRTTFTKSEPSMTGANQCVVCGESASKDRLQEASGWLYVCSRCGGFFEVGDAAQRRIENGHLHPDIEHAVRGKIALGVVPRIEFDSTGFSVKVVPNRSQERRDRDRF
ncbi:hypothetical protein [Pandoraea communis]|uniref:hypothetical protein n=1 Tax=Pandoraea communis TaxID=2508297 RepID=UPI0025A5B2A6|nr:hypothetical protein [Pandoraea communis]MDM8356556.1 hypothetical protein [Pandoraea communis]